MINIDLAPDIVLQNRLKRWSRYFAITVLFIAILVLVGWQWNIDFLKRPLPNLVAMNPATALAFIFAVISFVLIRSEPGSRKKNITGYVSGSLTFLTGIFKVIGLPIDRILFSEKLIGDITTNLSSQMAPNTAFCLIALGIALFMLNLETRKKRMPAQYIAVAIALMALLSIIGYIYQIQAFYTVLTYIPMAIHTAFCFLLISFAMLFAHPGKGIMQEFTSTSTGGLTARSLIPIAIIVPILLGLLRLYTYWTGFLSTEMGVALLILSIIVVFIALIWYNAILLNKRDFLKKQTENELFDSEKRLSLLVSGVKDYAIFMVSTDGLIISWNDGASHIKGYTGKEIIGKHMSVFYTEEEVARGEPEFNLKMAKENGRFENEGWRKRKDGSLFWADVIFTAIYDDQNQLKGFAKITRDITERKNAEKQIAYLAKLVEQSRDAIVSLSEDSMIISWNKGAELLYGHKENEVIGKNIRVVIRSQVTDEQAIAIRTDLKEKKGWQGELMHLNKKDHPVCCLVSVSQIEDQNENHKGFVYIARDITERKKLEKQLQQFNAELEEQVKIKTVELINVFERVSDGFMAFNKEGQITYVNKKTAELNKRSQEELIGKNVWTEFSWIRNSIFYENFYTSIAEQKNMHFEMFSPDLGIWIENYIYPSPDGLSLFFHDITEQKKAEAALKHSEEIRRLIMNSSLDAIVCINNKGAITVWNQQAEKIFGWKENEIIGKQMSETIVPDHYRNAHTKGFEHYLHTGQGPVLNKVIELSALNRHGKEFPIEIAIVPIKQENKELFCAFIRDISARKMGEEQIIREKELSDSVINSLPGVFYLFDSDGKFLRWNKNFEIISGYDSTEINNMTPIDFFGGEEKLYITDRIKKVFVEGTSDAEAHFVTKQGKRIPYYFTGKAVFYHGSACAIGTGIDISLRKKAEYELRLSEKKYKLLFERNPMPMWILSLSDHSFIDVNNSALQHYGYTREEFMLSDAKKLRPVEEQGKFLQESRKNIPGISHRGIWRHKKKDGSIINVEIYANDYVYEGKDVRLVLSNDITEKLKAEESLKNSYAEIRQLASHLQDIREQERAGIAREIHDELGQQLTGLKMDVSWISKRLRPEENESIKQKITGTLELLDETIKTVRRIATDLRPSILDDLGLIAAIEWHSQEFEKRTGIATKFESDMLDFNFSPAISIGLFRICQESLTNAARHADAKKILIILEQKNSQILLTIKDDGKGFDVNTIRHKKTLGLLGMKERTLMMGGKYDIISEPGNGTTLSVKIPFQALRVNT